MHYVVVDTDVVSYLMHGDSRAHEFESYLTGKIPAVTFITVAELHYGAVSKNWSGKKVAKLHRTISMYVLLPWDLNLARLWGHQRAQAQQMGHPLFQPGHSNDLWIATCAIYHEAPLLTNNRRHMRDLPGLQLADDDL